MITLCTCRGHHSDQHVCHAYAGLCSCRALASLANLVAGCACAQAFSYRDSLSGTSMTARVAGFCFLLTVAFRSRVCTLRPRASAVMRGLLRFVWHGYVGGVLGVVGDGESSDFSSHHLQCTYHKPEGSWRSLPTWTVISSDSASIPPRRRARGATWQKVTPKKLFGPKRDYPQEGLSLETSTWKFERAQVLQRCAAWVWPLSLGAEDLICC